MVLPEDSGPKISVTRPRGSAADTEREVDADRAGRDGFDGRDGVPLPEAHDGALAKLLLDLADGHVEGLDPFLSFVDGHVRRVSFPASD